MVEVGQGIRIEMSAGTTNALRTPTMSTDVFANFSALDELIQVRLLVLYLTHYFYSMPVQVIYQGVEVFTVLSNVSDMDDRWSIHLSSNGRWWKGYWTSHNVLDIVVRMLTIHLNIA